MNRGQGFLLFLILAVGAITLLIVLPFLEYVIVAMILAYVLFPAHVRIERRLSGVVDPGIASFVSAVALILTSILAVALPLAYITRVFVADLTAIAQGESDIDVVAIEEGIEELTGAEVDLAELLAAAGSTLVDVLFDGVGGVVGFLLHAALGAALVVFLVYYLLLEGPEFVGWLHDTVPLPDDVTDGLFEKVDATTWGDVIGHISVALLQAIIAGIGLWAVGIPNVVFWTFVMAVLALLPLIGAFLVWGPAALYLVVVDQVAAGILLALYGLFVISMVDNYARPIVIDQSAHLNPGVILIGVFGGVYAVGFTGLFVGPIAIGMLAATLETFREDYERIAGA